jgi:hypothetical protein
MKVVSPPMEAYAGWRSSIWAWLISQFCTRVPPHETDASNDAR